MKLIYFIFLLSLVITGCSSREVRIEVQGASYCLSSKIHFQVPLPDDEKVTEIMSDPDLNERFTPKSIRLAIAYGIWKELQELVRIEKIPASEDNVKDSLRRVDLENIIYRRIQLMSSDISGTASEFGCYVDRFTEILKQMKERQDDIIETNTLLAILSGALSAVAGGLTVYNNPLNEAASILGGIVVTYFSYKAYKHIVTIEFKPKSTNLKDLWFNVPVSTNYSSSMWFIFTKKVLKDEPSPRDLLIKRWIENKFLGTEDKEDRDFHTNLFFGTGGISTIEHITDRKEMNQEVKTLILLLEQDVNAFRVELSRGEKRSI